MSFRPKTARNKDNMITVIAKVNVAPHISNMQIAGETDISVSLITSV